MVEPPTYHFLPEIEQMTIRLGIWHKIFLEKGMEAEQSRYFLKELYLHCDKAFGWSQITYNQMVDRATNPDGQKE